jgi:hypothetical protein
MNRPSLKMQQAPWVISLIIFCSLILAVIGGMLKITLLVHFWYLAVLGIAGLILSAALIIMASLWQVLSRRI